MKKISIFIIAILLLFCVSCAENEQELGGEELADGIINGSIEMSDGDKATLVNIFNLGKFESDIGNCDAEVKVQIVGRALTYHSECGNFNDAKNGEHYKLSDAQREVVNALLSGYVTIGELSPERKVYKIIDTTHNLEMDLPDVEQVFFEDENYKYIFGMPIAEYVVVKFSDGTSKQLRDALSGGEVEITDLDKYGIPYYKEQIGIETKA